MAHPDPQTTFGALFDGLIVANLLFGMFTMQVHIYYRTSSHTICTMHGLYVTTIMQHGQIIDGLSVSFRVGFFFCGTSGAIVQVSTIDLYDIS
jgi:hypothetical protein